MLIKWRWRKSLYNVPVNGKTSDRILLINKSNLLININCIIYGVVPPVLIMQCLQNINTYLLSLNHRISYNISFPNPQLCFWNKKILTSFWISRRRVWLFLDTAADVNKYGFNSLWNVSSTKETDCMLSYWM